MADCIPSFNPITVESYAASFSCTTVVQDGFDVKLFKNSWLKLDDSLWLDPQWFNEWFSFKLALTRSIKSHAPSSLFHHCSFKCFYNGALMV